MNICLVGHEFYGNVLSGNGSFAISLVEGLLHKGFKITFITPWAEGLEKREQMDNLTVIRLPVVSSKKLNEIIPNILDIRWMFALKMMAFKKNFDFSAFDLIHILDVNDSHFIDANIKKKGIPLLISVNDSYCLETGYNNFWKFPYQTNHPFLRLIHYKIQKFFNRMSLKKVNFIIANSRYLKQKLMESYGIPDEKIFVIYRGKDVQDYHVHKDKYISKRILFVGSNMERKGIFDLIKSSQKILERINNAKLIIVGNRGFKTKKKIIKMIDKKYLNMNFIFYDHLVQDKVKQELSMANVFVLPSHIENLAQSILEAMASKTPVVVTAVGGNCEAVNSDCGIIVNKGNSGAIAKAILTILGDQELAKNMGENGYNNVKNNFSTEKMIMNYEDLYKKAFHKAKINVS